MKSGPGIAVLAAALCAGSIPAAAQVAPDMGEIRDCSLLEDPERSPSVWRHLRWAVGSTARTGQRLVVGGLGWNVWSREVLCRRESFFESELVYSRTAWSVRLDVEYDVDDAGHSAYRPGIEYSSGASNWGWIGFAASAGPKIDHRGVAANAGISIVYIGIEMGLRFDQGLDYDERAMSAFIGLTDLHLHLDALFSDYQQ